MWLLISDHQCLNTDARSAITGKAEKTEKSALFSSCLISRRFAAWKCFFSGLDLSKGVKKKTFHHIRNSGGESRYQKHNKTKMYHQWQDVAVRGAPHSEECSTFHVISNRDSQVAGGDRSHLASMQKKQDSLKRKGRRSLCMSFTADDTTAKLINGWLCLYILRWVSALSSRK